MGVSSHFSLLANTTARLYSGFLSTVNVTLEVRHFFKRECLDAEAENGSCKVALFDPFLKKQGLTNTQNSIKKNHLHEVQNCKEFLLSVTLQPLDGGKVAMRALRDLICPPRVSL